MGLGCFWADYDFHPIVHGWCSVELAPKRVRSIDTSGNPRASALDSKTVNKGRS